MTAVDVVLAPGQHVFFEDLAGALVDELVLLGVDARVRTGRLGPPEPGRVDVLLPVHEWFTLLGDHEPPDPLQLRRTVAIGCEQPGTGFYERDLHFGSRAGAYLDISSWVVQDARRRGLRAEHLRLGWTARWAVEETAATGRDLDVVFAGSASGRRERILASLAPSLRGRHAHLLLVDGTLPLREGRPGVLMPAELRALFARARVVVNVHQGDVPYAEHLRLVQAACSRAAVVTEHAEGLAPLLPGTHVATARESTFPAVLDAVLRDEPRRVGLAEAAYGLVREHPLARGAALLAEVCETVDARERVTARDRARVAARPTRPIPPLEVDERDPLDPSPAEAALLTAAKQLLLGQQDLRRRVERLERPAGRLKVGHRSPGHAGARPAVSALVALYEQAEVVADALESLRLWAATDVEAVVVDDGSSPASAAAVVAWSQEHPGFPLLLVRHPTNRGLGPARTTALGLARAPRCLVLDADNALEPDGLAKLTAALDADPEAAGAYGILRREAPSGPSGLLSFLAWDPERLRRENHVDALALLRTEVLWEAGGFTDDPRVHGWEDYDLWCTLVEHGRHLVRVAELVARYRDTDHSMRSVMGLSSSLARARMAERHPWMATPS